MKILSNITDSKDLVSKEYVDENSGSSSLRASVSVPADGTSSINIPFSITSTESLAVYQNGLLLTPTTHYTATTSAITLVGYTANLNDVFTFVSNNAEAGISLNATASQVLFSDTTVDNCYGECATVQDALVLAATRNYVDTSITTAITTALAGDY